MSEKRTVYYKDFGALGDGKTDDFLAIKACHDYANENGCKVRAEEGATYYIGDTNGAEIKVRTDVDWTGATFFLDDKAVDADSPGRGASIFIAASSFDNWSVTYGADSDVVKAMAGGFKTSVRSIGFKPGYPALIVVWDHNNYAYNRFGLSGNGSKTPPPQRELIIVDAEGNIKEGTEFLLEYTGITQLEVYRIDDEPITMTGGTFITDANYAPPEYTSYRRGITVHRSNTTITGLIHKIIGEGDIGAPYQGIIRFLNVNCLRISDCVFQSHKIYCDYLPDGRIKSRMGSYDFGGALSNDVVFYNCTQSNFFRSDDSKRPYGQWEYWGIMGSNWTKNITFDSCMLSRFDAHSGIYNLVIRNSTINNIQLIGGGHALIENCICYAGVGAFFGLRGDYGSTFKGTVEIKDCIMRPATPDAYIVSSSWWPWSVFGMDTTHNPKVIIDNLKIEGDINKVYAYKGPDSKGLPIGEKVFPDGTENINPLDMSAPVIVRNNKEGYKLIGSTDPYVNENITIIYED